MCARMTASFTVTELLQEGAEVIFPRDWWEAGGKLSFSKIFSPFLFLCPAVHSVVCLSGKHCSPSTPSELQRWQKINDHDVPLWNSDVLWSTDFFFFQWWFFTFYVDNPTGFIADSKLIGDIVCKQHQTQKSLSWGFTAVYGKQGEKDKNSGKIKRQ